MPSRAPIVAQFLERAGYLKVPGKRRYISPSGVEVSRRQAEQRSGAIESLYGVERREHVTRYLSPSGRTPRELIARDYARSHGIDRAPSTVMRSKGFREAAEKFRDRSIPWNQRRDLAIREFGWTWDQATHQFRYPT